MYTLPPFDGVVKRFSRRLVAARILPIAPSSVEQMLGRTDKRILIVVKFGNFNIDVEFDEFDPFKISPSVRPNVCSKNEF